MNSEFLVRNATLRQLQILISVANTHSYTKAANISSAACKTFSPATVKYSFFPTQSNKGIPMDSLNF